MFKPTQADVRRFFCAAHAKQQAGQPMEAIERNYDETPGHTNPFLHLSMHLSISEQCSIDQPRGIRQAVELLARRLDSLHEAHHVAMECLGQMLWEAQRSGRPPDGEAYVASVQRRATAD
jgi:hypothetical protein